MKYSNEQVGKSYRQLCRCTHFCFTKLCTYFLLMTRFGFLMSYNNVLMLTRSNRYKDNFRHYLQPANNTLLAGLVKNVCQGEHKRTSSPSKFRRPTAWCWEAVPGRAGRRQCRSLQKTLPRRSSQHRLIVGRRASYVPTPLIVLTLESVGSAVFWGSLTPLFLAF